MRKKFSIKESLSSFFSGFASFNVEDEEEQELIQYDEDEVDDDVDNDEETNEEDSESDIEEELEDGKKQKKEKKKT